MGLACLSVCLCLCCMGFSLENKCLCDCSVHFSLYCQRSVMVLNLKLFCFLVVCWCNSRLWTCDREVVGLTLGRLSGYWLLLGWVFFIFYLLANSCNLFCFSNASSTSSSSCCYYLRQGGKVFARLCLFVCLSVCVLAR